MEGFSLTSVELEQQFGISKTLSYAWFDALQNAALAKRAPGRQWGTKLFSEQAAEFLKTRRKQYGPMNRERQDVLLEWMIAQESEEE